MQEGRIAPSSVEGVAEELLWPSCFNHARNLRSDTITLHEYEVRRLNGLNVLN
jgi:hypothetical protein